MRRWNGWGDDGTGHPFGRTAARFLTALVGEGTPPYDAPLPEVLASVPRSRLPEHRLVVTAPLDRLQHARGQSLPDWIALRSGRLAAFPDGVAYPGAEDEVAELLRYAAAAGAAVIPYGGGTSVVGHINPLPGSSPVLTIDLRRLNALLRLDTISRLATLGAGICGPELEARLRARGFTLGHYPQSFDYSTLGGWVASRSCGQQSLGYGRIERLFCGGRLVAPAGTLVLPSFPASAAGPDLREVVLGSEGRMGVLTEVTVKVSALPETEAFHAVFMPGWEEAHTAAREILQSGAPLSMVRVSSAAETVTTLALAGHERLIHTLERLLAARGVGEGKCMIMLGFTGREAMVRAARKQALDITGRHGGIHVGRTFGKQWHRSRFRTPYLRNTLWERGYAIDTLETAAPWQAVPALVERIDDVLARGLADNGERVHVFTHLSQLYPHGSSIYTTYLFRIAASPEETEDRWRRLKTAASQAIVAGGGTISHQHGVGVDHQPYLAAEKGDLGLALIGDMCRRFDPDGLMNPGKLLA